MRFTTCPAQMIRIVNPSGFISFGAIAVSLALVVLAIGGIYYLLFDIHGKQLSSYDELTEQSMPEPIRYSIKKIPHDNHTPKRTPSSGQSTKVFKKVYKLSENLVEAPTALQPNDQPNNRPDTQDASQSGIHPSGIKWVSQAKAQPSDPLEADTVNLAGNRKYFNTDLSANPADESSDNHTNRVTSEGKLHLFVRVPVGRIRQTASEQASVKAHVYKGERVDVVSEKGSWIQIHTDDGRNGWAHQMLFSVNAPSFTEESKTGLNSGLIKGIRTKNLTDEGGEILIELNDYCLPNTSVITGDRPRVVSDFYGVRPVSNLAKRIEVNQGIIVSIRLGIHNGDRSKTRVVIDLVTDHDYIVDQQFLIADNIYHLNIHL